MLKAFKTGDPNGNGIADEIPFDFNAPSTDGWGWFQPNQFLGGRGIVISAGGNGEYAQGGEIKNYLTDPAYRELVVWMRELWQAGVISDEAFTHDWSQYIAGTKGEGTTAKVGVTIMWTPSDIFGTELADQYITIPQLYAEEGQSEPLVWGVNQEPVRTNRVVISEKVKNKEAALKLVDAMFTPDLSVQMAYGSFGVGVEKLGENEYQVLEPADPTKNASDWQFMNSIADGAPGWVTQPGVKLTLPAQHIEFIKVDAVYDENYENVDFGKDVIYGQWTFTEEEDRTRALNSTGITQTAMSKFAQWVTQGGVENEWDAYVADLERNNLEQNTEIAQAAYDRFMALMAENNVDFETFLGNVADSWTFNDDGTATYSR